MALLVLAGCSESTAATGDGGVDGSRPPGSIGTACVSDDDCRSGPCVSIGAGTRSCSAECATPADCPVGWECADGTCGCDAASERCNGEDDDCDGLVDEGPNADCGSGEICVDAACECETECAGECVDLQSDPRHCGACGQACADGMACRDGACCTPEPTPVDLLLMIDNSNSTAEEQVSLAEQIPRIARTLASGELRDPDTGEVTASFPPVPSLHLGVVTLDMGTGGFEVPSCDDPEDGDDGILRTSGNLSVSGCMETYPTFLEFRPGEDVETFGYDATCIARLGTGGCGFEQPLEAVLKAITPSDSSMIGSGPDQIEPFLTGTGHADGPNAGFLRDESLLTLLFMTDEGDCSARDPDLYNPDSATYTSDLNLRCFEHPEALFPVDRYVKGYLHARRGAPERLVVANIAGVPPELVDDAGSDGFDAILGDERLQIRIDEDMPTRIEPSCNEPGRGLAYPPRRMIEVARGVDARGGTGVITSVCQADFTTPVVRILDAVTARLSARCD